MAYYGKGTANQVLSDNTAPTMSNWKAAASGGVNYSTVWCGAGASGTTLGLFQSGSAQALATITNTGFSNTSQISSNGFYIVQ